MNCRGCGHKVSAWGHACPSCGHLTPAGYVDLAIEVFGGFVYAIVGIIWAAFNVLFNILIVVGILVLVFILICA